MTKGLLGMILAVWLLSGGCALRAFPPGSAEFPYRPAETPHVDTIIHVATGTPLSPMQLYSLLSDARVIYIAESHNNVEAHRVQAAIIESLATRFPGRIAVGLEMFPYTAQPELDRWVAGELNKIEIDRLWGKYWNVDVRYYRTILDVVQKHRMPVLGLNAPKTLVREVSARTEADPVPTEAPDIDLTDAYQKEFLRSIYAGHMKGEGMLDRFVLIQSLWEETMAQTAAEYLRSAEGKDKKLIVLAGGHHINFGFGIPRRLFRRLPETYYTVNPEIFSEEEIPEEELMDVDLPDLPLRVADFYWAIPYVKLDIRQPVLGVMVRAAKEGGLEVVDVLPESVAARSGLSPGDIILSVDGNSLEETGDLRYFLRDRIEGETVGLELRRNGEPAKIEIVLDASAFEAPD